MSDEQQEQQMAADDNAAVTNTPAEATQDDSPEKAIDDLRRQLDEAKTRAETAERAREEERRSRQAESEARAEAERRARQANEEAGSSRRSAADAQYDSVVNALHAAQGELASARMGLKTALAEGDFDKVAEFSEQIGLQAARVRSFEDGKTALEQRRAAANDTATAAAQGDPREAYIRSRTPRTAAWLRRNDRFFTDNNFQQMVQGAHALAVGRGIEPDSDEYFRFIEEQSGLRQAAAEPATAHVTAAATTSTGTPASAAAATTQRQSAPAMPAAPPAGSATAATRSAATGTVTLSPEQVEFCRINDIDPVSYAKRMQKMLQDGEIGTRH